MALSTAGGLPAGGHPPLDAFFYATLEGTGLIQRKPTFMPSQMRVTFSLREQSLQVDELTRLEENVSMLFTISTPRLIYQQPGTLQSDFTFFRGFLGLEQVLVMQKGKRFREGWNDYIYNIRKPLRMVWISAPELERASSE